MAGTTWPSWTGRFWTCRKYDPSKRRRLPTLTQCHIPEDLKPQKQSLRSHILRLCLLVSI